MSRTVNCLNCGKTGYSDGSYDGGPKGWLTKRNALRGAVGFWCSNKCKDEFNNRNSSSSNSSSSSSNSSSSEGLTSTILSVLEKKPKSEYEIAADERLIKKANEEDARMFDSIKKLFFGKKNKAAKELHLKLEEIEADIRIAISKGDIDEAGKLIRQLKHDSNLFVPKTNTSYSKYWAEKREECLNKL